MEITFTNQPIRETKDAIFPVENTLSSVGPQVLIVEYEKARLLRKPQGDLYIKRGDNCGLARLILHSNRPAKLTKHRHQEIIRTGYYEDKHGKVCNTVSESDPLEILEGQEILFTQMATMLHAGSQLQTIKNLVYDINLRTWTITMFNPYSQVNLAGENTKRVSPNHIPMLNQHQDGSIQYGFEEHRDISDLTNRLLSTPRVLFQTDNSRYTTVRLLHKLKCEYDQQTK